MMQTFRIYFDDGTHRMFSVKSIKDLFERLINDNDVESIYKIELVNATIK